MKRLLTVFAIAISFFGVTLADVQPGYVRTIKRPGKKVEYISGAQISVKGVPGSFRSKDKGRFELELRPRKRTKL